MKGGVGLLIRSFRYLALFYLLLPACSRSQLETFSFRAEATGSGGEAPRALGSGGQSSGGQSSGGQSSGGQSSGGQSSGGQSSGGQSSGGQSSGGQSSGGQSSGGQSSGGQGGNSKCREDVDCRSADACLKGQCVEGSCEFSSRDLDLDTFVDVVCGGSDCNDLNPTAFPGAKEDCSDGADNDCNGVMDCFDPACRESEDCGCVAEPTGEVCESTSDEDCDGSLGCNDSDCAGTEICGCSPERCGSGSDEDCDGSFDCEDSDCAESDLCVCAADGEDCSNGIDDDCDGLIDCADPQCGFSSDCLCLVPQDEICNDSRDNDCDGTIDCGDPSCFSSAACAGCSGEVCEGGGDEDCDGLIDCADPSCALDDACPPALEECNNGRDDDLDTLFDCDDPDCFNVKSCREKQNTCATAARVETKASASYTGDTTGQPSNFRGSCGGDAGEAVFVFELLEPRRVHLDTVGTSFDSVLYLLRGSCEFGEELACDDDSGGLQWSSALDFPLLEPGRYFAIVDGLTVDLDQGPNEGPFVFNIEISPVVELCADNKDNDGDGFADCADSECATWGDCATCNSGGAGVAEYGASLCTDGLDNDCDGLTDCEDDDCSASEENLSECCNGLDQNGNGIPDDFSCRCQSNDDCSGSQICYTSTLGACGIPCGWYSGEVCSFFASGSSCNDATGQCEF